MIKLIASDLDGTLLLNGAQSLLPKQIQVAQALLDRGFYFAAASGRQQKSLEMLFGDLAGRMLFISENGAQVSYQGRILAKNPMERELAMGIIEDVYNRPGCEVLISGEVVSYIRPKTQEYFHRMTQVVKYQCQVIEDFEEIQEDILKVAVYDMSGVVHSEEYFLGQWGEKAQVTVSGEYYMDFTQTGVNKGRAMKEIQEKLGLRPQECMAFGDNHNDIQMLDAVGEAYVMASADREVQKHGKYIVDNVEDTLERLFLQAERKAR